MYTITILDTSKKTLRTFRHINKITYANLIEDIELKDDAILSHSFSLDNDLHFYSDTGNYTISAKIIGTLEIEKEI